MTPKLSLTHPGIILRDEFFGPTGITQLAAAKATGRLSDILSGRHSITTAARLGRYFGTDPRNWLDLQTTFDLRAYRQELARVKRVA